jgi:hypothetical protein
LYVKHLTRISHTSAAILEQVPTGGSN